MCSDSVDVFVAKFCENRSRSFLTSTAYEYTDKNTYKESIFLNTFCSALGFKTVNSSKTTIEKHNVETKHHSNNKKKLVYHTLEKN